MTALSAKATGQLFRFSGYFRCPAWRVVCVSVSYESIFCVSLNISFARTVRKLNAISKQPSEKLHTLEHQTKPNQIEKNTHRSALCLSLFLVHSVRCNAHLVVIFDAIYLLKKKYFALCVLLLFRTFFFSPFLNLFKLRAPNKRTKNKKTYEGTNTKTNIGMYVITKSCIEVVWK